MATTLREYLDKAGVLSVFNQMKAFVAGKKYAGSTADGGTANKAASIPFGSVDSTSVATAFTATVDGITELRDGICVYLKNTVITSAAASTTPKCFTLNINGLGAKPVYQVTAAASYATTHFTKNYKYLFTYDSSLNSGNGGWYIGQIFNSNTTYSDMTQAEITAGTGTTGRKITPKMLRDNFYTEDEVDDLLASKANSNELATVATSGSYNDLDDTPTIPAAVTESTVSGWGFTKNTGTYSKPSTGIPASDLADAVQTSLGKADTALQSFTETDPTVPAWAKAANKPSYTAAEVGALPDTYTAPVTSVNGQTGAVTVSAGDTNVIESVSFNGTTAPITNKNAAITYTPALSQSYVPSSSSNNGLVITGGDTYEQAMSKIHKTILDDEEVSARAAIDLDSRIDDLAEESVRSATITGIVTLTEAQYEELSTKDSSTLYIITSS